MKGRRQMLTMTSTRGARSLAIVLLGLLLVACSPAASVAPSSTASVTAAPSPSLAPTASPSPSPSPSPSASAAAAADPAVGLKIGAPYALSPLDPMLEASFRQQFTASAGAFGSLIGIGGRNVSEKGVLVGYILVIGFPPGVMSDAAYNAMVSGLASSTQVTLKTTTISGVTVSSGSSAAAGLSVFRDGDNVVVTLTPTAAGLTAITTALVTANH
jgi:hypothetical protein